MSDFADPKGARGSHPAGLAQASAERLYAYLASRSLGRTVTVMSRLDIIGPKDVCAPRPCPRIAQGFIWPNDLLNGSRWS
jgi:hypothetical protein